MFESWPSDNDLDIKRLRMKAVALLSLVLMLRPSDVAPKSKLFDPWTNTTCPVIFSTKDVHFTENGGATIWIRGTKNDTDRAGFQMDLVPHSNKQLDPVACLQVYIHRTESYRPTDTKPVFISLRAPYRAISADTVSTVLQDTLRAAGLYPEYTAKDFRPTGATNQIQEGFDPEVVMRIGRWKTTSVFFEHYVHAKTPQDFSDKLLK